jgi:hypothetical protein
MKNAPHFMVGGEKIHTGSRARRNNAKAEISLRAKIDTYIYTQWRHSLDEKVLMRKT